MHDVIDRPSRRAARRALWVAVALLAVGGCGREAGVRDYLLVAHRPNHLAVVDAKARTIENVFELPGAGPPTTVVPSPDGRMAYVLTNHSRSVSGIDLATGEEVFRADLDESDKRVTCPGALAVSPDGKELFVYELPVARLADRYRVEANRIAVYDTSAGVGAERIRSFPAERRTMVLAFAADGSRLYAMSWDIVAYDPNTGDEQERIPLTNWQRQGYSRPDWFDAWPSFETSDVWVAPYVAMKGDVAMMGLAQLDLASGEFATVDVEPAGVLIFSAALNPVRRNEVFGAYTTLSKIDRETGELLKRIDLDHTYYSVAISTDGNEVYVGSTLDDVAIYDTQDLRKLGEVHLPSGNDQGLATIRLVRRAPSG